ncbi:hypothetical protein DEO72_LG2g3455 [Vigna unguiculata]|uniref:Ulp1 protease family n=1 Tax=Vigna unguiculata TaxID=3917 RepID=A0A4D6L3M8_VIGUN|nr:hypothetical protein DEO72_LG2g3455 [Vigna unguiculata]
MLMSPPPKEKPTFKVIIEELPQRPDLFECGIMVLKYLEHWEPNKKYNGQSMPTYSGAELQQFRQDYICDWVLDAENIHRDTVLFAIQYNTFDFPTLD